jgi:alkylhydroperoxidase family enzyme
VRFDSARVAGLNEDAAARIDDAYATSFDGVERAALELTDAIIGHPGSLSQATRRALEAHLSDAQIVELALGVGLFLGMSKVLINLGLEPEDMPVTVMPTPGSAAPAQL